jgi:hypothetical protein
MEDYTQHQYIFSNIEQIILDNKEPYLCEGSVWCLGGGSVDKCDAFEHKRHNLFKLAKTAKNIIEIGFNAGHSTAIMLLANPDSKITIFDLGEHPYTRPALEYLKRVFPGRIIGAYFGDSTQTLTQFVNQTSQKFDLLHIDGGHERHILQSDFDNCEKIADKDHYVVVDDDDWHVIGTFNRLMVTEGRLKGPFTDGFATGKGKMCHFIGKYSNI